MAVLDSVSVVYMKANSVEFAERLIRDTIDKHAIFTTFKVGDKVLCRNSDTEGTVVDVRGMMVLVDTIGTIDPGELEHV